MPTTQYTQRYTLYRSKSYQEVVPVLKFISMNAEAQLRFPTMKVLKAIAKKLLLNLYEALYLAFCVKGQWFYQDVFFAQNSKDVRDIIFYRRPEPGYQSILTFLLLQTASIKMTLNDNFRIYTAELESTLPNFRPILKQFMKKFPLKEPTPKQLNLIYKQMIYSEYNADYENMVDNIMHLCPTYRVGEAQQASSNTNTITNKRHYSKHKTNTIRQTEEVRRFQLRSQRSQLQKPIIQQQQSKALTEFFVFDIQNNYQLLTNDDY